MTRSSSSVVELRVHGVSNTPPAAVLRERGLPDVEPVLVAGDAQTGCWRRTREPSGLVTEAYSWGRLTSGRSAAQRDLRRAGWALLLPFALVNVALWARPDVPVDPASESRTGRVGALLVRLLAVSLTATLTLAAVGVGMDQVGWQCRAGCPEALPGTGPLQSGALSEGLRPVAAGALLPLAVVVGLWLLGRRSFRYEAELPDGCYRKRDEREPGDPQAEPAPWQTPLEHPGFFRGDTQVRRLAALHLAAALIAVGGTAAAAGLLVDERLPGAAPGWTAVLVLGAFLLAVAAVLAVVVLGSGAVRFRVDPESGQPPEGYGRLTLAVLGTALAGTVLALLALALPRRAVPAPDQAAGVDLAGTLPGFAEAVGGLAAVQLLLLLVLAALARGPRRAAATLAAAVVVPVAVLLGPDRLREDLALPVVALVAGAVVALLALDGWGPGRRQGQAQGRWAPAWGGRGAALLAGAGWATGCLYSAAVLFGTADHLNGDATVTARTSPVTLPPALLWAALGLLPVLLLVAVALVWLVVRRLVPFRQQGARDALREQGFDPDGQVTERDAHERQRARDVGQWRAVHRVVGEEALPLVGTLAAWVAAVAVVVLAGTLSGEAPIGLADRMGARPELLAVVKGMTDLGAVLSATLLVGLAAMIGAAYRGTGPVRRVLGVVWDLATYWPRGAHPFAPPCYADRVVPQLLTRVCGLPDAPGVVLSGHSQGAVIAAAVVLQLPSARRDEVALLTYGTQITRLYGRVFPDLFGPAARHRLAVLLSPQPEDRRPAGGLDPRAVRWRSLWRATDPLGWPVQDEGAPDDLLALVDVQVGDPERLAPSGGELLDPPVRQHSDYPCSLQHSRARHELVRMWRGARPPAPDPRVPIA